MFFHPVFTCILFSFLIDTFIVVGTVKGYSYAISTGFFIFILIFPFLLVRCKPKNLNDYCVEQAKKIRKSVPVRQREVKTYEQMTGTERLDYLKEIKKIRSQYASIHQGDQQSSSTPHRPPVYRQPSAGLAPARHITRWKETSP